MDSSYESWCVFFKNENKRNTRFIYLLKKNELSYLTSGLNESSEMGFLHNDYLLIRSSKDKYSDILVEKNNPVLDAMSRLVLSFFHGVSFSDWLEYFGENFISTFEDCLVYGDYERYDLQMHKILNQAIKCNLVNKENIIDMSILRGIVLSQRYGEEGVGSHSDLTLNRLRSFVGM